jgi:hypothetical protein
MNYLDQPLPIEIRQEVLDALIAGLRVGHRVATDNHKPDLGFDGFTYGTTAWRLSTRWIIHEISLLPNASAREITNSLRVFADGFIISVYAGGSDLNWDLDTFDFDRGTPTKRAIPRRNALNLQLSFDDLEDPILQTPEALDELTVVHCGNPQDELAAVYVGAAIFDEEFGRSRWAWSRRIFRFDAVGGVVGSDISAYRPHDEVELQEVPLELRRDEPADEAADER